MGESAYIRGNRQQADNTARVETGTAPTAAVQAAGPEADRQALADQSAQVQQLRKYQGMANGAVGGNAPIPPSGGIIQAKLVSGNNVEYSKDADLPIGEEKKPSKLIKKLIADSETYYLPKTPATNYETAASVKALKKKKYILGESHGSGMWEARTAGWDQIPKMLEGIKGFKAEDDKHGEVLNENNLSVKGKAQAEGIPLEDSHHYTLGGILLAQQLLNSYETYKSDAMLKERITEVTNMLLQYVVVGHEWAGKMDAAPAADSRQGRFLQIGQKTLASPAFALMKNIRKDTKDVSLLTKQEIATIQTHLTEVAALLLELIDTRPMGGGFLGMGKSRQGADPIKNRDEVTKLSKAGAGSGEQVISAIRQGSLVRELAMIENIKSGTKPLMVQIGDEHVDRVASAVGADAVAVPKTADFDGMITENAPPDVATIKKLEQPSPFRIDPDNYFPGMHDFS